MFTFLFMLLLYFLPAIMGRDKKEASGIFLLNLFLGWTLVGWVAALIWACASDYPAHLRYAPASGGRFCSNCGTPAIPVTQYCSSCGARV